MSHVIAPALFRHILGHYPTGVCAVTAMQSDGAPSGMVVGSFTSVSLDPPLVGFFPDKASTSWPKIAASGGFCVNILADDQEDLCRRLASRNEEKFSGIGHRLSETGMPILDNVVAWIECSLYAVHDAGDHVFVLGEVHSLGTGRDTGALLFSRGGYGKVAPLAGVLAGE